MSKIWIPSKLKVPRYIPRCHATIQNSHATISVSRLAGLARPKKSHATIQTVPRYNFWLPMGTQKTQKNKGGSPNYIFQNFRKRLKKKQRKFQDLPEPSERSRRLHKTLIFTYRPCPHNGIEMTSQNFSFCYLWNPTSLKMPKKECLRKKHVKKHSQKTPSKCHSELQKVYRLTKLSSLPPQCSSPPGQTPIDGTSPQKKSQTLDFCKRKRKSKEGRGKKEEESRRKGGRGEKEDGRRKRKEGRGRGNKEEKRRKRKEGREKAKRKKEERRIPKPIAFPNPHIFDEHASSYIIIEIGKQIQRVNYR